MGKSLIFIAGILLIIAGVMTPVATIPIVFILPETFASTARIVPGVTEPSAIGTEMEKIRSTSILYQVITNLNLNKRWAEKIKEEGELRTEITYALLKKQIDVRQGRSAIVIDIKVFSDDKNEAAAIANEIVEVYRQSPLAAKGPVPKSGVQVLDKAVPGLRPVRPNKPLAINISLSIGVILAALGGALLKLSRNRAKPGPPPLTRLQETNHR